MKEKTAISTRWLYTGPLSSSCESMALYSSLGGRGTEVGWAG